MDFKKKMIVDYGVKLNEILGSYRAEYNEIIKKTLQMSEEVKGLPLGSSSKNEIRKEEQETINNAEMSDQVFEIENRSETDANLFEEANQNHPLEMDQFKVTNALKSKEPLNEEQLYSVSASQQSNKISSISKQTYGKYNFGEARQGYPINNQENDQENDKENNKENRSNQENKGGQITECTIEDTVFEDQTNLFDNSINLLSHSVNQSFFQGERRKARRRTGKLIVKRRFEEDLEHQEFCKRQKTEKLESFLVLFADQLAALKNNDQTKLIEILKAELIKKDEALNKKNEELSKKSNEKECALIEKLRSERKDLDRLREDNMAIASKIEQELKDLQIFKQTLISEIKKVEEDKKSKQLGTENAILEKIRLERKAIQEEYAKESKKLDTERTILIEEKKVLEDRKALELKLLEIERKRMEKAEEQEFARLAKERKMLEQQLADQNMKIENERRLINNEMEKMKKTLEVEREKVNQTLCEEREKMNQTVLEVSSRPRQETLKDPLKINFNLPIIVKAALESRQTLASNKEKSINELFQLMKREHLEKQCTPVENPIISTVVNTPISTVVNPSPFIRKSPAFDIDKMSPHSLYKKSIDLQTTSADPKKYVPKTFVPLYKDENEFESDDKKFTPALFTKDPKLNYIVKNQNQEEIRCLFGNKKDIDVEKIFNTIENVSNFSPNKLRRNNSK